MGVSLLEVIEHGGYDITSVEDARWLLAKQSEFADLVERAEKVIEESEEE